MSNSAGIHKPKRKVGLRWRKLADPIQENMGLRGGSVTLVGDKVYWAGENSELAVLSRKSWRWTRLETRLLGIGSWHVAQLADEKIYIFGGAGSHALVEFDIVMELATDIASDIGDPGPKGRRFMTSVFASWRNEIVTFGGFKGLGAGRSNETHAFNTSSKSWKKLELRGSPPPARTGHAAALSLTKMFIFGGFNRDEELLNDLWIAELGNWCKPYWSRPAISGNVPSSRTVPSFHNLNGNLVLFGGYGFYARSPRSLYIYSPQSSLWQDESSNNVLVDDEGPPDTFNHLALTSFDGILYFTKSGIYLLAEV